MHVIHDLRLVLIAIAATLKAIRQRADAKPLPQEVEHVDRLVESGLELIDELLSSHEQDPIPHIDINAIVNDVAALVTAIVGPEIKVRTTLDAAACRVFARRVDIERILLNLVFNATAAMPDGGTLMMRTGSSGSPVQEDWAHPAAPFGDVYVTVSDTGRGMSDEELANAINPLARPRPDGTGLGLASVALILTRLSGTLGIESRQDGGTVVSIALPLSPSNRTLVH